MVLDEKTGNMIGTGDVTMATEDASDDTKKEDACYENPLPVNPVA